MEPQNTTSFTGESQSQNQAPIDLNQPKKNSGGKVWKIVSICAIVLAIGLGAGFTYFLLDANDLSKKNDDLGSQLLSHLSELAKYKEMTGTNSPDEITNVDNMSIDFVGLQSALSGGLQGDFLISLEDIELKDNKDSSYQTLSLSVFEGAGYATSFTAYLYRSLSTDGEWKYSSNYSGLEVPTCDEVSEEEEKAFAGVLECTKSE